MIRYGTGDTSVVVGIVFIDAAADFDVDGIYGAGTYSFELSLNILEFPVRKGRVDYHSVLTWLECHGLEAFPVWELSWRRAS